MKLTNKKGFTLVELLVVIAIIGILFAAGTISYRRSVQLSRDGRRKSDLEQLRQAFEVYRSEEGVYPSLATWENDLTSGGYLNSIPTDPKGGTYVYEVGSPATTYSICSYLEAVDAGTLCSSTCGPSSEGCNYEVNQP